MKTIERDSGVDGTRGNGGKGADYIPPPSAAKIQPVSGNRGGVIIELSPANPGEVSPIPPDLKSPESRKRKTNLCKSQTNTPAKSTPKPTGSTGKGNGLPCGRTGEDAMQAKHTPGKWETALGETGGSVYQDESGTIATLDDEMTAWRENAALIAAAPELLELARSVVFWANNRDGRVWPTVKAWTRAEGRSALLAMASAAIAKSEGRTHA